MLELIDRLSPDQRQVLTLKFVFRFSNGEVGVDPRQERRGGEVAPAPRARLAPEARHALKLGTT